MRDTRRGVLAGMAGATLGTVPVVNGKPNGSGQTSGTSVHTKVNKGMDDAERCRLPASVIDAVGVEAGQQVRLLYEGAPAVFTVEPSAGKFGHVSAGGRDRLGATGRSFRVDVESTVVNPTLSEDAASEEGGFIERLSDPGVSSLAAIAPHGGYIEWGTDTQAERLGERLGATAWYGAGWWPGGGAFRRWHVTSTDIHPASFPALADVADRGFDHAVSFHGWSESHVAVGGAAPRTLREEVRDAVAAVVDCEVRLATDESRDGDSPENVVNWLTASGSDGVQLEQPRSVREDAATAVADAVADVFAER